MGAQVDSLLQQAGPLDLDLCFHGVAMDPDLARDFVLAVVGLATVQCFCYNLTFFLKIQSAGNDGDDREWISRVRRLQAGDILVSQVFFPLFVALAAHATWELKGTTELRWHSKTVSSHWVTILYMARMMLDLPIQWAYNDPMTGKAMALHHVLSVVVYSHVAVMGRMHFWACFAALCEIPTIFMNTVCVLNVFIAPSAFQTAVLVANEVVMLDCLVVFRLVMFPWGGSFWVQDIQREPEATWDRANSVEKFYFPFVTVFTILFSICGVVLTAQGLVGRAKSMASDEKGKKTN